MELDGCSFPDDRLYDLEHDVWIDSVGVAGVHRIGVLSSLASFAGRFTGVSFRPVGPRIEAGRSIATVESIRYTGAIRVPVDVDLVEQNRAVVARPKLLNDAPYSDGWVARIRPLAPLAASTGLLDAPSAMTGLRAKITELRIQCYPAAPDLEMYEIGAECAAIMVRLDEELARRSAGDIILLITDDPTSAIEMVRWSDRTGHSVLLHRADAGLHHFLVRKEAHPVPRLRRASGERG